MLKYGDFHSFFDISCSDQLRILKSQGLSEFHHLIADLRNRSVFTPLVKEFFVSFFFWYSLIYFFTTNLLLLGQPFFWEVRIFLDLWWTPIRDFIFWPLYFVVRLGWLFLLIFILSNVIRFFVLFVDESKFPVYRISLFYFLYLALRFLYFFASMIFPLISFLNLLFFEYLFCFGSFR